MNPDFSILIATFNAASTLRASLENALAQTGVLVEVIVADSVSKDETVAIVEEYKDRLAWWESSPDTGVYDAWNKMQLCYQRRLRPQVYNQ